MNLSHESELQNPNWNPAPPEYKSELYRLSRHVRTGH